MITYLAARFWIYEMSGSTPQNRAPGEYFPAMEEARFAKQKARSADRRNRLWSVWSVIVCAPLFVTRQTAKMVPGSLKTALTARAQARILARNIERLESLAPHLLDDIGVKEVAPGQYAVMKTDETLVDARKLEPAATAVRTQRHTPADKPTLWRVRGVMASQRGAIPH